MKWQIRTKSGELNFSNIKDAQEFLSELRNKNVDGFIWRVEKQNELKR